MYAVVTPSDAFRSLGMGIRRDGQLLNSAQNSQGQCTHKNGDCDDGPDNASVQTLQCAEPNGTSYLA